MMFKKKGFFCYILIFLILLSSINYAQGAFIPTDETEEETGFGIGDALGFLFSLVGLGLLVLLRYFGLIPDPLFNFLLILAFFGVFYALQTIFDAIGFQLNIGGIIIPPLAIGFLMIFLVYHNAILQLITLLRTRR